MTSEPRRADHTVPRPPNRLVPPMTAAAMASRRSVPPPVNVPAAWLRETASRPPTAARRDDSVKTATRTPVTLMPARRAASAFPPIA